MSLIYITDDTNKNEEQKIQYNILIDNIWDTQNV